MIAISGIVSVVICIVCTMFKSSPDLNVFAELAPWGELVMNICISIIAATIFYITQIFIPEYKTRKVVKRNINLRLGWIVHEIDRAIMELGNKYLSPNKYPNYSAEDLHQMQKFKFSDETTIGNMGCTSVGQQPIPRIKVKSWLIMCMNRTEYEIDKLFQYYGTYLPSDISDVLEKILHSKYHHMLKSYSAINDVDFSTCNDDFVADYWALRNQIVILREQYDK